MKFFIRLLFFSFSLLLRLLDKNTPSIIVLLFYFWQLKISKIIVFSYLSFSSDLIHISNTSKVLSKSKKKKTNRKSFLKNVSRNRNQTFVGVKDFHKPSDVAVIDVTNKAKQWNKFKTSLMNAGLDTNIIDN
jgi:hypothetical protein